MSNGIVFTGAHAEVADLGPEIIGLSAYGNQSCMNSKEGEVWCWGQSPSLGTGRDGDTATPHKVYAITDSVKVETGGEFACSLGKNGTIKCWGKNNLGQTGNASQEFKDVYFPEFVAIAMNSVDITLGESHGCALNDLEEVWCWGDNKFGQMGDRIHPTANLVQTKQFSSIPRRVEIPEKIKAIDSGSFHTCALTNDSFVYCWGANFSGQLGTGMSGVSISTPKIVPALSKVDALSAGYNSTCAKSQEQLYCWGEGSDGQLGESESFDRPLPRIINRSISSVILGPRGACGIESKAGIGSLVCWGKNSGYEPTSAVTTSAAIGDLHGCLITVSKTLNCWGSQQYGQTGQGTSSSSFIKSTIVTGIPQWRNYINSWSVVYKNDVAVISWSGAAQNKFVLILEPFGQICETTLNFTCDVGPLESNKTYFGLIIARGATDAQTRMAQISFSTGKLQSAYDAEKELERIKIADETASIKAKSAAAAAEAINNAAAKATDAANAATDAANLASDAADNATAAAQEALYAANAASVEFEEITKQVATLMAVLKAQIKTLSDTVAKISKKAKG